MATAAVSAAPLDGVAYAPPARQRVDSIDLLRGLVMVIMMLDHTRDYFSVEQFQFDPTDLSRTSIALFLTRWITHFCAPVFVLLAGAAAFLHGRGKTRAELSRYLLLRGADRGDVAAGSAADDHDVGRNVRGHGGSCGAK